MALIVVFFGVIELMMTAIPGRKAEQGSLTHVLLLET